MINLITPTLQEIDTLLLEARPVMTRWDEVIKNIVSLEAKGLTDKYYRPMLFPAKVSMGYIEKFTTTSNLKFATFDYTRLFHHIPKLKTALAGSSFAIAGLLALNTIWGVLQNGRKPTSQNA